MGKIIFLLSPIFDILRHFGTQMIEFLLFSPKMTYFHQINQINDTFDHGYDNKLDRNNFYKLLWEKLFAHFPPQILT